MKNRFYVGILLIIGILIYHVWFFNFSILSAGDWWYFYSATQKELLSLPFLWNTAQLGGINIGLSMYPINLLWGFFSIFTNFAVSERVLYLYPSLLLSIVTSYYLIKNNIRSPISACVGSIVFTYNTYFIIGRTGHFTLMVAFSLAPLALLLFQKMLEKKSIYYSFLTSLVGFTIGSFEFRGFYIVMWVLFFYLLYFQFFIESKNTWSTFGKNIYYFLVLLVSIVLLNAYWLFGFLGVGALSKNELFSRILFGNEFLDSTYAFTLFHPFWTGAKPTDFIVQRIPIYFWLVPIIAFLGFFIERKNKKIVFFGFIALLGVLLTKQVGQPFSGLYPWLYKNFPGFGAFREASKFYFLIALGYSVLFASFIDWLWNKQNKFKLFWKYFLTTIIIIIFAWNVKPVITGEIGNLFKPKEISQEYITVENYLLKDPQFYRTLWVPQYSRWSLYTNNHPAISFVDAKNSFWNSFIATGISPSTSEAEVMMQLMKISGMKALLDTSSVKYVIVPLEDGVNDEDFFGYYGNDRQFYIRELGTLQYLKKVNLGTKKIVIYENDHALDHIYTSTNKIDLENEKNDFKNVVYNSINPTEYKIHLTNVKRIVYLNLAESFHPQWKIRIGKFNWIDSLIQKNYFLSDAVHFQNNSLMNSFTINPTQICTQYSCRKNGDGSFNMDVTLYFKPQTYSYIGLAISIITFSVLCVYLLFYIINNCIHVKK